MKPAFRLAGTLLVVAALAGCDTSQGIGRVIASATGSSDGPDEFGIVPTKPLETPPNFTDLPEPEVGARNLVDPLPAHDAVAALGGRPDRLDSDRINAGEGTLLAATQRRGTASNIRQILADEDAVLREENGPRLLERWFGTDTYFRTYEDQTLEARSANERARRRGIRTPTVYPPDEE